MGRAYGKIRISYFGSEEFELTLARLGSLGRKAKGGLDLDSAGNASDETRKEKDSPPSFMPLSCPALPAEDP